MLLNDNKVAYERLSKKDGRLFFQQSEVRIKNVRTDTKRTGGMDL